MCSRGTRPVRSVSKPCIMWSRRVSIAECSWPIRYCFERPTASIARLGMGSDQVGEVPLDASEVPEATEHNRKGEAEAQRIDVVMGEATAEDGPAEAVDDPGHR